jgi:hypothetical protein
MGLVFWEVTPCTSVSNSRRLYILISKITVKILSFGHSWNLGSNCIRVRLVPLLRVYIRLGFIQSPIKRIVQVLYQNQIAGT